MVSSPAKNDNIEDVEQVEEIGLDGSPEGEEEGHSSSPKHDATTTVEVGGYTVDIDNRALPYIGLILSAVILLIAIVVPAGRNTHEAYGIAVSVVTIVFASFGLYMVLKNTDLYETALGTLPMFGQLKWGTANAQFLFLWSFIAAGILTFDGPFLVTSNGYFASWACVVFALVALGVTPDSLRSRAGGMGYANALMVASIIQICAIAPKLGGGKGNGQSMYSLIVCILTIILVVAIGAYPHAIGDRIQFYAYAAFSILWIVLACFVTFKGPFTETGNGYFSAWLGCILCLLATSACATQ